MERANIHTKGLDGTPGDGYHSMGLNFIVRKLEKLSERCEQTYDGVYLLSPLNHRCFSVVVVLHSEVLPVSRAQTRRAEQNWASEDPFDQREPRISHNYLQRLG